MTVSDSVKGWTWGKADLSDTLTITDNEGKSLVSIAPGDVSQAPIQGRSDLALEFIPDAVDKEDECIAEMRLFGPNDDLLQQLKDEITKR